MHIFLYFSTIFIISFLKKTVVHQETYTIFKTPQLLLYFFFSYIFALDPVQTTQPQGVLSIRSAHGAIFFPSVGRRYWREIFLYFAKKNRNQSCFTARADVCCGSREREQVQQQATGCSAALISRIMSRFISYQ